MKKHPLTLLLALSGVLLASHWLITLSPPLFIALKVEPLLRHGARHSGLFLAGLARAIGNWSTYAILALVLLALLRRVPAAMGTALAADLALRNGRRPHFHTEAFVMHWGARGKIECSGPAPGE